MSGPRILRALTFAGLAALVFQTHVFVALQQIRVKVVEAPVAAAGGVVRVATTGFPKVRGLRPPFALIARIKTSSAATEPFTFLVGGVPACDRRVAGGATRRVDCAVTAAGQPGGAPEVVIQGPSTAWRLEYLELATHHGNTSGVLTLFVLPWNSTSYVSPAALWTLVLWIAVAAILVVPPRRLASRPARLSYWTIAGAIGLLLAISQCSQWVSAYRVVLPTGSFMACLAVLLAPRLWVAGWWVARRVIEPGNRSMALIRAGLAGALVLAVFFGFVNASLRTSYAGNYSGFLQIARSAFDANPLLSARDDVRRTLLLKDSGYDGQFMYFAAFDPFLRAYHDRPSQYRLVMDSPAYRFGRVGFSLLARVVSGDHWQWYPAAMVWLILGSLGLAGFALARLAQGQGAPAALGLLIALVPGFWPSLQVGLPEPVAAAGIVAGILCFSRGRWVLAGALFAVSLLVRETGIVAVACVVGAGMFSNRRREAFLVGLFAIGVMAIWRLYVAWVLYPDMGIEAVLSHPPDLGWPFAGIADLWRTVAEGGYYKEAPELSRAAIAFPVLLAGGLILSVVLVFVAPSPTTVAALVYALIGICLNFRAIWVHVANGQRGTFEVFVMLALSSVTFRTYPRPVRAGLVGFWCAAAAYVFFLTFDAAFIRSALGLPF